jgi:protein TonB
MSGSPVRHHNTITSENKPLTPELRSIPFYPPKAIARDIRGSVLVCFTVEPDGTVSHPYVKSASSKSAKRVLGKAATYTISQWEFFPEVVNGKPVATNNVCQTIHYGAH